MCPVRWLVTPLMPHPFTLLLFPLLALLLTGGRPTGGSTSISNSITVASCRALCLNRLTSVSGERDVDCRKSSHCFMCWNSCGILRHHLTVWTSMCTDHTACLVGCRVACDFYMDRGANHREESQHLNPPFLRLPAHLPAPHVSETGQVTWGGLQWTRGSAPASQNVVVYLLMVHGDRGWRELTQTSGTSAQVLPEVTGPVRVLLLAVTELGLVAASEVFFIFDEASKDHHHHFDFIGNASKNYLTLDQVRNLVDHLPPDATSSSEIPYGYKLRPLRRPDTSTRETVERYSTYTSISDGSDRAASEPSLSRVTYNKPAVNDRDHINPLLSQQFISDRDHFSPQLSQHVISDRDHFSPQLSQHVISDRDHFNPQMSQHVISDQQLHAPSVDKSWTLEIMNVKVDTLAEVTVGWAPRGSGGVEYLLSWLEESGFVSGHLLTDQVTCKLSLWPAQAYYIQVELIDSHGNAILQSLATPVMFKPASSPTSSSSKLAPTSLTTLPFINTPAPASTPSTTTMQRNSSEDDSERLAEKMFTKVPVSVNPFLKEGLTPELMLADIPLGRSTTLAENAIEETKTQEMNDDNEEKSQKSSPREKIRTAETYAREILVTEASESMSHVAVWCVGVSLGAVLLLTFCSMIIWMLGRFRKSAHGDECCEYRTNDCRRSFKLAASRHKIRNQATSWKFENFSSASTNCELLPIKQEDVAMFVRQSVEPEDVNKEIKSEFIRKEKVKIPEMMEEVPVPLRKQAVPIPVRKQAVPIPVRKQLMPALVRKQVVVAPVRKQVVPIPVRKQVVPIPVRKQVVTVPVRK
ncbi:uncharacterized protein [Cherax quadricarinatus]|uniref:uncharacterized protein n=1 Tax=Cherax quadricarinatus TaxID=27406 RepID=UPI00387EE0DF